MIQSPRYKSLLRSLYTAVLQSNLSTNELKLLSQELRRGQLSDELAYMLDKVSEHFQGPDKRNSRPELLIEAQRTIKERKISKSSLFNIIRSIDDSALSSSPSVQSMRQMLDRFFEDATDGQARKLLEILSSLDAPDPYLKGITDSRE